MGRMDRFASVRRCAVSDGRPRLGCGAVLQYSRPLHRERRSAADLLATLSLSAGFGGLVYSDRLPARRCAAADLVRDLRRLFGAHRAVDGGHRRAALSRLDAGAKPLLAAYDYADHLRQAYS